MSSAQTWSLFLLLLTLKIWLSRVQNSYYKMTVSSDTITHPCDQAHECPWFHRPLRAHMWACLHRHLNVLGRVALWTFSSLLFLNPMYQLPFIHLFSGFLIVRTTIIFWCLCSSCFTLRVCTSSSSLLLTFSEVSGRSRFENKLSYSHISSSNPWCSRCWVITKL